MRLKGIKNLSQLAKILEYNSPEKLYRLERNPEAKPSIEIIEDFTNKFEDLNLRWFISGFGEPLSMSQKQDRLPPYSARRKEDEEPYQEKRINDIEKKVQAIEQGLEVILNNLKEVK